MHEDTVFFLNLCFPIAFIQSFLLLSMASCMLGDHRCQWLPSVLSVKMVQMRCHRMTNHLSVLTHVGIGSIDPFASVNTPNTREFEARHSHPFPDPTRNTTDKV